LKELALSVRTVKLYSHNEIYKSLCDDCRWVKEKDWEKEIETEEREERRVT